MRSKLFVSGARPELFAKALGGGADALSFDLEDSVPDDGKAAARRAVSAFIASPEVAGAAKLVIVRTNGVRSEHFEDDLAALARPGVALINVPKCESAADVVAAVASLERAEDANDIREPIRLLVNIETPRALRAAGEIAGAHARVAGLQLGLGDLFEPFGVARGADSVHAAMFAVRMAAAEAGVFAVDGAFADVGDDEGFRAEATIARRLGFVGKSCIHPRQIALANAVFRPTETELAAAARIVAAAAAAAAEGRGAFLVDGRMIDLPFLKRAQALLAAAGMPSSHDAA